MVLKRKNIISILKESPFSKIDVVESVKYREEGRYIIIFYIKVCAKKADKKELLDVEEGINKLIGGLGHKCSISLGIFPWHRIKKIKWNEYEMEKIADRCCVSFGVNYKPLSLSGDILSNS